MEHDFNQKFSYSSIVFLCILVFWGVPDTFGYQHQLENNKKQVQIADNGSRAMILSVLETRISDKKILDKVAEKLLTLSEQQLATMSSLCDHISLKSDTAGAHIAFSLITAMIVLS